MYFWKWSTFSWNYLNTAFEKAEKSVFWKLISHRVAVVLGASKPSPTLGIFHMTDTIKVLQTSCQPTTHWPYEMIIILLLQMGKLRTEGTKYLAHGYAAGNSRAGTRVQLRLPRSSCSYSYATPPATGTFIKIDVLRSTWLFWLLGLVFLSLLAAVSMGCRGSEWLGTVFD